jgi:DNA-binding response OmpR family regulator
MDWEMPKLSGIEVCRWLRSSHLRKMPYVIMVTSKNQPQDIQLAYEAGADDYLTKPADLKYLRRRIASVAERLDRRAAWMEQGSRPAEDTSSAGLSPLDIYLSDLRLMRRKT